MNKKLNKTLGAAATAAFVSIGMLSGCSQALSGLKSSETSAAKTGEQDSEAGDLKVMASFYPMYDFAVKIGGDKAVVTNMVPSGTEPHDWEPATTDIKNLEEADLFIYSGAGMEHWVDGVLAGLGNKKLVSAEASEGISLLPDHDEEEEQAEEGNAEAGNTEEHAEEEEHGHGHGEFDPHVWLSPMKAKKEMENIRDAFIKADPDNQDYYETNYETYAAKFDELDQKYKDALSDLPNKDIVVSHEAFGYLCDAYGLNQVGIEGLSPDSEPDPARMAEIIDFVKANHVKVIFFEELVSPKVANAVAKEAGADVQVLNPLEGLSDEELQDGADYFTVMENNLKQLEAALK